MPPITQLIPGTRPGESYGEFRVFGSNPSENNSLNLFCEGLANPYGFLNLYVSGCNYFSEGTLNLFACNIYTAGSLNLFTSGEGFEPGAIPISGSLNLYIERLPDASLNLYCSGEYLPTPDNGQLTNLVGWGGPGPLYGNFEQNIYTVTGSLNLAILAGSDYGNGSLNLYCHGF